MTKHLRLTGSKSEANRLLILQQLTRKAFEIENLSNAKDTQILQAALANDTQQVVNIGLAGTAMRFLTAYYAVQKDKITVLTGEGRMLERPIKILVDALRTLGCKISYEGQEGYPPIKIIGTEILQEEITIQSDISSQYITALMLIAPFTKKGLQIHLAGKITSLPYILMTLKLLERIGVDAKLVGNTINITPINEFNSTPQVVESDWSAASYFYSYVAISKEPLVLESFREDSLQGDKELVSIYKQLGVATQFLPNNQILLEPISGFTAPKKIILDLNATPDIAQTIAVTCCALGVQADLYGLGTLKIKETDRLIALENELSKFGAILTVTNDSLHLTSFSQPEESIEVKTYHDHRMAMAFAPLLINHSFTIENPMVVEKSYPDFWKDCEKLNLQLVK